MLGRQGKIFKWFCDSAGFITFLVIADVFIAILYCQFTLSSIPQIAANIMIFEGALLLMIYALLTSRGLLLKYKDRISIPELSESTQLRIHIPRGGALLLCAIILIILGFILDLAYSFIKGFI